MKVRLGDSTTTSTSILLLTLLSHHTSVQASTSSKRGLAYVSSSDHPNDDAIWTSSPTDLAWYYNYSPYPTSSLSGSNSSLTFVPMLWGAPTNSSPSDSSDATPDFPTQVLGLIDQGMKIPWVLAFNEPDGSKDTGGSDISPSDAAKIWTDQIIPLRSHGVKVGLPAVTGSSQGSDWLSSFLKHCSDKKTCDADFLPIHWYGPFAGLQSYLNSTRSQFPDLPIWITEIGDPDSGHADNATAAQGFLNQTVSFLDTQDSVTHYAYFGAFRSNADASGYVGPEGAMLDKGGGLTDIGAWYLGRNETGNNPQDSSGPESVGSKFSGDGWKWKEWLVLIAGFVTWVYVDEWVG